MYKIYTSNILSKFFYNIVVENCEKCELYLLVSICIMFNK